MNGEMSDFVRENKLENFLILKFLTLATNFER